MDTKAGNTGADVTRMVGPMKTPARQLRALRSDPEGRGRCDHEYLRTSHVSGIERVVCEVCGHVSIKSVGEAITKGGIPSSP